MRPGVVPLQPDGRAQGSFRLDRPGQPLKDNAQLQPCLCRLTFETDDLLEVGFCDGYLSLCQQGRGEVLVRIAVSRLQADSLLEAVFCLREPTAFVQSQAEGLMRFRELGVEPDCLTG